MTNIPTEGDLAARIERYCRKKGIGVSTFGRWFNRPGLVPALRAGLSPRLSTVRAILAKLEGRDETTK